MLYDYCPPLRSSGVPLLRPLRAGFSGRYLTVEAAGKWYALHVVDTEAGTVESHGFDLLEPTAAQMGVSAYHDHCPNPTVLEAFAEAAGLFVPQLTLELVAGRWKLEG